MINNLKGSHTHAVFSRFIRIMKLINLFFIAGICFANAASSYSQSTLLTLEADNNTLEEVFKMIEKNSEYVFFYSDKAVNLKKKVSINVKDQTIDKILDQVLLQTGIHRRRSKKQTKHHSTARGCAGRAHRCDRRCSG